MATFRTRAGLFSPNMQAMASGGDNGYQGITNAPARRNRGGATVLHAPRDGRCGVMVTNSGLIATWSAGEYCEHAAENRASHFDTRH
jgi:hypothetical protein